MLRGIGLLRDYIQLEYEIRTDVHSVFSEENEEDVGYLPALIAYHSEVATIKMEVLDSEWQDLCSSGSFLGSSNQDDQCYVQCLQNVSKQRHVLKALNTRRLKIIHSIYKVLRFLRNAQKERGMHTIVPFPEESTKKGRREIMRDSRARHTIQWIPQFV